MIVITSAHCRSAHCRASYRHPTNFAHVSSPRSPRWLHRSRFISFHFISFRSISSPSHLILFYTAHGYDARKRGKRRFLVPVYIFFSLLVGAFYSAVRSAEHGVATEEKEVLGFIPVVNNIFIAASSEEKRGAKVQFRGMFAVPVHASSARHNRTVPRYNSFVSD